jgi:hypothetical protein
MELPGGVPVVAVLVAPDALFQFLLAPALRNLLGRRPSAGGAFLAGCLATDCGAPGSRRASAARARENEAGSAQPLPKG